jgi:hypothetical protein
MDLDHHMRELETRLVAIGGLVPDESPVDLSEASVPLPALSVIAIASPARVRGEGAGRYGPSTM